MNPTLIIACHCHGIIPSWNPTLMECHPHGIRFSWNATLKESHPNAMSPSWNPTLVESLMTYHPHGVLLSPGTDNVVKASIRNNVQRIIYTSSIEIMVRYGDMQGADESYQPAGRPSRGYADTKARAEAAVLRGNGTKTTNGKSCTITN